MATISERSLTKLPYGVGRITGSWLLLIGLAALLFSWGLYAYTHQLIEGEIVTGLRNVGTMRGVTWGLYVVFVIYFIGVSFAGIAVATLIRLFNLNHLRPVARMAELLTVITLILGAFSILIDLGQPLRGLTNLFRFARPQSPFFGTFTLVISGYLLATLVYLYLDSRQDSAICARMPGKLQRLHRLWAAGYRDTPAERERHKRVSFWLAIAIFPLLVTAHSTLGFVFGLQVGRPGWYSALQAPAFVILAGVSGVGALLIIAAALRRVTQEEQLLSMDLFRWLGKLLMILILTYLYFMIVEVLTGTYTGHHHEVRLTEALLWGQYAWIFWLSVALLVAPLALLIQQALTGRWRIALLVASGILVNLAAIGKRYLIVVPSQTHGALLPYGVGSYTPTWVEYSIIIGLFGLGTLLFALFMKAFPIMHIPESGSGGES
ncbi:MAG: NrfD/PsrC family molybdoenzyme membrane anchor subunit [Anaerolineae bacterium]